LMVLSEHPSIFFAERNDSNNSAFSVMDLSIPDSDCVIS